MRTSGMNLSSFMKATEGTQDIKGERHIRLFFLGLGKYNP